MQAPIIMKVCVMFLPGGRMLRFALTTSASVLPTFFPSEHGKASSLLRWVTYWIVHHKSDYYTSGQMA